MDDEMNRETDREATERPEARPSGEPSGVRQATTPDDGADWFGRQAATATEERDELDDGPSRDDLAPEEPATRDVATGAPTYAATTAPMPGSARGALFGSGELTALRDRWTGLQAAFVDDPAAAVRQADTLLGEVLDTLQRRHRQLRDEDGRQGHDGEADTEAMRVMFLRYRSMFTGLLG